MNCQFRREALSYGSIFLKKSSEDDKKLKKNNIKDMVKNQDEKFTDIYYASRKIKATKEYIKCKKRQLLGLIDQLGLPTFFIL